jgi:hypothetical protein
MCNYAYIYILLEFMWQRIFLWSIWGASYSVENDTEPDNVNDLQNIYVYTFYKQNITIFIH